MEPSAVFIGLFYVTDWGTKSNSQDKAQFPYCQKYLIKLPQHLTDVYGESKAHSRRMHFTLGNTTVKATNPKGILKR